MRIAQASVQAGVAPRLLRYYEDKQLLTPDRDASGYRDYTPADVETVRRIRQLLDAGLSTTTIRRVLPCLIERAGRLEPICDDLVNDLLVEQRRIEDSITALTASRDAIQEVIDAKPQTSSNPTT